ncbi:unnamed protein product [Gongylonema pulchrum]|uniref:ADH_N domain-containing protein n=1 Tax=Gongylonema pulchrum TaxID=637853 RepID=A0A183F0A5_9BILA|nr:unnamed protein product [Gongylonema pulchrum]
MRINDDEKHVTGDRVAIEPGVPCRKCDFCKRGRYNLCHDMEFFALPPTDGALRRFVAIDADYCFKLVLLIENGKKGNLQK